MKRYLSLLLAALLALSFCACGSTASVDEKQNTGFVEVAELTQSEKVAKKDSSEVDETEEPVVQETSTSVDWTEFSYDTEDSDGYTFKVTIKLSPWILYSETDTLDAAWAVVSKGKDLPTFDSWGFKKDGNQYWKPYDYGSSAYFDAGSWGYIMSDIYYCVGSVSIQNTTNGWDITSDSSRSAKARMVFEPYKRGYNATTIAKILYSSSSDMKFNGISVNAKMTSNTWGPVPFVFVAPENFAPNTPDGEYLERLQSGYFEIIDKNDLEPIYVDIIGKNGEHFSSIPNQ